MDGAAGDPSPVINWDFLQSQSLTSFSRTSNATLFDSTGKLTYAANNLLRYSNQFNNSGQWGFNTASLTASGITDPFGGISAVTLTLPGGAGSQMNFAPGTLPALTSSDKRIFAIWAKSSASGGAANIRLSTNNSSAWNTGVSTKFALTNTWQQIYIAGQLITSGTLMNISVGSYDVAAGFDATCVGNVDIAYATFSAVTYETTPRSQDQVITTANPYYGPRYPYAYNGTTWDAQGLLVEAAATNLFPYSEAVNSWSATNGLIAPPSSNVAIAPNGVQSADKIIPNGVNTSHFIGGAYIISTPFTFSVYVKAAGYNYAVLATDANYYVYFDLVNGTVMSSLGTGWASASIENVGNSWFRISASQATSTTTYQYYVYAYNATQTNGNASPFFSGNGTDGIYIWGAQLETGSTATSYIPNLATGTTQRNADTSLAFSAISLPTGLSFSRASNAMQYDAAGRLTYAPNNIVVNSGNMTATGWSAVQIPATATTTPVPDGTTTAYKLAGTISSYVAAVYQTTSAVAGTYTWSVYAKADGANFIFVFVDNGTDNGVYFDLAAGAIGNTVGTVVSKSINAVGNGWFRCQVTVTNSVATIYPAFLPSTTNATGRSAQVGTTPNGVLIWGAQLEAVTYETVARPYVANSTANPIYGPRYDYDPVTRLPKGLLVEEARTNVATNSNTFSNGVWVPASGASISSGAVAPDGTSNAWTYTNPSSGVYTYYYQNCTSGVAGTTYTFSMFMKKGTERYGYVILAIGSLRYSILVDLETGLFVNGYDTSTPLTNKNYSIVSAGNGWYRISVTGAAASSGTVYGVFENANTSSPVLEVATNDIKTPSFTYGGTALVYGAQLEAGSFPTSYIPTVASSVQRTADVATLTGTALTTLQGSAASVVAEAGPFANIAAGVAVIWYPADFSLIEVNNSAGTVIDMWNGSVGVYATLGSGGTVAQPFRAAIGYSSAGRSIVGNGGTVGTGASTVGTVSSVSLLQKGSYTSMANGYFRKFAAWNVKLADAKLQTKSVVGATL